jgi:hypothetical protein
MTTGINTSPKIGKLRIERYNHCKDFPVGCIVKTPSGNDAKVIRHTYGNRGIDRGHLTATGFKQQKLVCVYMTNTNRRKAVITIAPWLVELVEQITEKQQNDGGIGQ